jgi:hydrogenase expression/formation protein HypE
MLERTNSPATPSSYYAAGKLPPGDLSQLLSRYTYPDERVIVMPGIGKDATVISLGNHFLVAKTDPITFAADEIGWYAVHVNANDVAVMGGTPRWFLATLLLPDGKTRKTDVEAIFAQISRACRELGISLCGGHTEITVNLDRPIVIGQMLGEVAPEKLVVPEKARVGDEILLTKGIAIEGTSLIAREWKNLPASFGEDEIRRCRDFLNTPGLSVVREALVANEVAEIHAMHDPTEGGLATGLHELAAAASVGMVVDRGKIPVFPQTAFLCRELGLDPLGLIASGALLIVAPAQESAKIRPALQSEGIASFTIGRLWEKEKGVKMRQQGILVDLPVFPRDEIARLFERGES